MNLVNRILSSFRKRKLESDMADEMRHHLEEQTRRNIGAGMPADEAAYAARREFGNLASIQEQAREVRGWLWLDNFLRDIRIGVRVLARERAFFLIAAGILAIGVCGVTAQFSVINSALIRGLPFPDAEQLVRVAVRDPSWAPGRTRNPFMRDLLNWSQQQQSFTGLVGYFTRGSFIVTIDEVPLRFPGSHVTGPLFSLLGVRPAQGRDFTAEDQRPEAPRVTVISDSLWRSDFGADPAILGRAVRLNGKHATVVGVMPPGFNFPAEQLWMPMFNEFPPGTESTWTGGTITVIGRLKPGVSIDQAASEVNMLVRRAAQDFPATSRAFTEGVVEPLAASFVSRDIRQVIWVMTAAVAGVLLIACVNVMNMQFARAVRRARELAVRGALGASRARLIAQMLVEGLLVAVPGGAAGALLSVQAVDLYNGSGLPSWMTFELDPRVLLFTLLVTGATVLLSALLPALVVSRTDPLAVLKAGGRSHTSPFVDRVAGILVVAQFAATTALLVASLLLVKSVANRYALDFGYDPESVLAGRMNFSVDYPSGEAAREAQRRVLERLRSSPHFSQAAFSSRRNNLLTSESSEAQVDSVDGARSLAWVEFVSDGYFATLGLRPVEGREFEPTDTAGKEIPALVNVTFARKHFGGRSALGARVRPNVGENLWCTVVGVVPDTLMQGAVDARRDGAGIFLPSTAFPHGYMTLVVRGRSASAAHLAEPLRREVLAVNPNLAVYTIDTPRRARDAVLAQVRTVTRIFGLFGAVAMVLSAVGLYGVVAFFVGQRTHEFGIRMALGAAPRQIWRMILAQGGRRLALGGGLGLALALAAAQLGGAVGAGLLYDVSPRDPRVYAQVLGLLAATTLLACLVPARRATKVDPMVALRTE